MQSAKIFDQETFKRGSSSRYEYNVNHFQNFFSKIYLARKNLGYYG